MDMITTVLIGLTGVSILALIRLAMTDPDTPIGDDSVATHAMTFLISLCLIFGLAIIKLIDEIRTLF